MSFIPLEHKAAGHDGSLQSLDGSLFIKPTSAQEVDFYNETQTRKVQIDDDVSYGDSLCDWMPEFIGTLYPGATEDLIRQGGDSIDQSLLTKVEDTLEIEGSGKQYLILNNILSGFSQPSIMDIKLGSILYDESANAEKVKRMKLTSKSTTSGSLKFRIAGMMTKSRKHGELPHDIEGLVINNVTNTKAKPGYVAFDKYFGRKLTEKTVSEGLEIFFRHNDLPKIVQDNIINNFHVRLQMLYNCLLDEEIRIVSGSLLFVFENDINRWEAANFEDAILSPPTVLESEDDEDSSESEDIESTQLSCLKLIDFAHAKYTPGEGHDEEIVSGVENLFNVIENL